MKQHPDHHTGAHSQAHEYEHMHEGAAEREHDPTELGPSDPYPFIYSRDPFDERRFERRFAPPGTPYGPASNRVSRGATAFSVVVICVLVGLGLLVIVLALVGR